MHGRDPSGSGILEAPPPPPRAGGVDRLPRLSLSRRPGEQVILTLPDRTEVRVIVAAIHKGKACLAIEAPSAVKIDWGELLGRRRAWPKPQREAAHA